MRRAQRLHLAALVVCLACAGVATGRAWAAGELIAAVDVQGNAYISREAILDIVKDILRVGDPYTEEAATKASEAVTQMGYFQDVTLSREPVAEGVKVVITVVERQRLEQIAFVGNTVADDTALRGVIRSQVGSIVDYGVIRRDVARLEEFYSKQGYIARVSQARVDPFGVLTFVIDEARIEAFKVEGLQKTKEWVVRRMIHSKPGALFRQDNVAKDLQSVFNLGIFQNVKSDLRPGEVDPTAVIVVVQVEEKRTGVASVAAAYSQLDNFVLMVSLAETNFRGRAERASVNVEAFGRSSYDLRFFEPFLDARGTTMDVSLFDTQRNRQFVSGLGVNLGDQQFEERRTGASVSFTRPTSSTQRVSLGLRSEQVSSSLFQGTRTLGGPGSGVGPAQANADTPYVPFDPTQPPGPGDLPLPIVVTAPLHPGGHVNTTTLGYIWDTRDLIADPRHGGYREVSWDWAGGLLGGDNHYSLYSLDQRLYWPMRQGKDVLALRFQGGTSTGDLPLFNSYSVGGSLSLRGYDQDRFRGNHMLLANMEYRYRMNESLGLVAFVDAGDAYGGTFPTIVPGFTVPPEDQAFQLHIGMGVGLRAITPLGPIRIDWGSGENGGQMYFGFGQVFYGCAAALRRVRGGAPHDLVRGGSNSMRIRYALAAAALAALAMVSAAGAADAPALPVATVDMGRVTEGYTALQDRGQALATWHDGQDAVLKQLDFFLFLSADSFGEVLDLLKLTPPLSPEQQQRLEALKQLGADAETMFQTLRSKPDRTAQETESFKSLNDLGTANFNRMSQAKTDLETEYNQKLQEARTEFMVQVTEAVKALAQAGGYQLVVDSSVVLWGGIDLTDQVLAALNAGAPAPAPPAGG